MKKLALLFGIAIIAFAFANSSVAHKSLHKNLLSTTQDSASGWTKATTWTGMKNNQKYIYKINPKSLVLYSTLNEKSWSAVVGSSWVEKNGNWIKIANKKLMLSSDKGETWMELSDGQWLDADGDWCKFDASWNLWVKKG